MKRFLFGCVVAVSGLAMPLLSAQDFCCPPQCDPCCCGVDDFNGFYVGGNIGAFTHTAHRNDLDGFLTDNSGWTTNSTSFVAGVQLGYDWQCCNKLFGLVADWNWANPERRLLNNPSAVGVDSFINNEFHWFSTIRARLGITVCDALIYLTGGAAVAHFHTHWRDAPDDFHHRHHRWGWASGVGTEFLLGCSFSFGAEFLFLHFDEHSRTFTSTGGTTFRFGHSDSAWLARISLNYRFGDLCSCW